MKTKLTRTLSGPGRRILLGLTAVCCALRPGFAQVVTPSQMPILAQAARTVGVRRCLSAIAVVAQRNDQGATNQDVLLDWDHGAPDGSAFFSLTGLEYGQGRSAALSLTTAPEAVGGGCSILAERISAAPVACAQVARAELGGYIGHPLLGSITVYVDPGKPRETITLINTAPGCLVIRRQVQYAWPANQ